MKSFASPRKSRISALGSTVGATTRSRTWRSHQPEVRQILKRPGIQAKLKIGPTNDSFEREADRVADQVMRMPDSTTDDATHVDHQTDSPRVQRVCDECEEELQRKPASNNFATNNPKVGNARTAGISTSANVMNGLTGGRPLPVSERAFFEPRFNRNFENVRIHDGSAADAAAKSINARAFTLGKDIVFAKGEYKPGDNSSRRLLAHELTHTEQQGNSKTVRRDDCGDCREDWETIVDDDHDRAIQMLDNTISKLASYNGTSPADVKASLERWFDGSSSALAAWVNFNLRYLRLMAPLAGYQCQLSTCGQCNVPGRYGYAYWCVPFTDIRVCDPVYFGMSDRRRSRGLVHEWVHKYGCNFDLGYCSGGDCPGGTGRALLNADPWSLLVLDLG